MDVDYWGCCDIQAPQDPFYRNVIEKTKTIRNIIQYLLQLFI